jgi:hypothetical protein
VTSVFRTIASKGSHIGRLDIFRIHKKMTTMKNNAISAHAYTAVPYDDTIQAVAVQVPSTVLIDHPASKCVSPEYASHMMDLQAVKWTDDFFDDQDDVIAVFDFDYDGMESRYTCVTWGSYLAGSFCCPNLFWYSLLGLVPCFLNRNVKWNVRAQHIALTKAGILFVHDTRKFGYGWSSTDIQKHTKLVSTSSMYIIHLAEVSNFYCDPDSIRSHQQPRNHR